jgi:hypothetical protein
MISRYILIQGGFSQFGISQLFDEAYGRAASVGTAINGFTRSGIWPVNPDVFQYSDLFCTFHFKRSHFQ